MNINLIRTYNVSMIYWSMFSKPKNTPNNKIQAIKNIKYYHLFYSDIQILLINKPYTYFIKLKWGVKLKNILLNKTLLFVSIWLLPQSD